MKILGVHDGHNSSATVVFDGKVVAAVQEERLSRVKNQGGAPIRAVSEVLSLSGIDSFNQFDRIVVASQHSQPLYNTRDDVLQDYEQLNRIASSLRGRVRAKLADSHVLRQLWLYGRKRDSVEKDTNARINQLVKAGIPKEKIEFVEHHSAHAAAAYYGLGNYDDEILVLTNDGAGDGVCATVSLGHRGKLERQCTVTEDHSLATIYAMITYLMGMVPLEHEYKIMGLAPYHRGRIEQNRTYLGLKELFEWDRSNSMLWRRRAGVPRVGYLWAYLEQLLRRERFDAIAAGLQIFTEEFLVEWVRRCVRETGIARVAVSGGIFMNVKANQAILTLPEVEELFVFPSCGDETNSIGAAYAYYAQRRFQADQPVDIPALSEIYLGGEFSNDEIEAALRGYRFSSSRVRWQTQDKIERKTAALLARGEVVARFKGRMEFGARALGNRSILANAALPGVVQRINFMIKARDFWMPFAPSILSDSSTEYICKPKPARAPYMIMSFDTIIDKREQLIAAIHPQDGTARPQEVYPGDNPDYESVLQYYQEMTGEGVILNTSLNLHGYPLVYSPFDALEVFDRSDLDYLAIGNYLVSKD